jgi:NO-binding membrane sensor protein with MHYT domain
VQAILLFFAVVIMLAAAGLAVFTAAKLREKTRSNRYRRATKERPRRESVA